MDIITRLISTLKASTDEKTIATAQHYFKEKISSYGVKVPTVQKIAKEYFKEIKNLDKAEIFVLCEKLWQTGFMEDSFVASNWSYFIKNLYTPEDFEIFERWVANYVNNWASCDTLCNHSIGDFMMMYADCVQRLLPWCDSENRWMRRAAAVTLIVPARRGLYLPEIITIADKLLMDKDDLVQKGYGWMLKAAGEAHQAEVFDYVMTHKDKMPRTALRYAIEKMPRELKTEAMKK